jgi:hypothetical protein
VLSACVGEGDYFSTRDLEAVAGEVLLLTHDQSESDRLSDTVEDNRALLGYAVIWMGKEEVWVRVSVVGMVAVLRLTICHQDPLTGKEA